MILKHARFLGPDYKLHKKDIRVEDARIADIADSLDEKPGEAVFDCSGYLLYPTLADCHVHTPDTLLRGLFSDMSLHHWGNDSPQGVLQTSLFEYLDNSVGTDEFKTLVRYAYLQYLKSGVGFIVETGQADESSEILETCAREVGLRALVDWYDEKPTQAPASPTIMRGTHLPEEEDLDENGLKEATKRVRETSWPLMTHCLETRFRRDEIMRKFGTSTVELLENHLLLGEKTILFHCVETSEKDRFLLASSKATIVHCPVSNLISGARAMHLSDLLEKNARITLGTDFLTHDIWEVMHTTYAELKQGPNSEHYKANHVWNMATRAAASAAEGTGYQGRIAIGAPADLLFIQDNLALSPLIETPSFSNIAYNTLMHTRPSMIEHIMIDGRWVMQSKRSTIIDEETLEQEYGSILRQVFSDALINLGDS
ncbi:MAG: amidohydrolase family protein [Sphaerochaeta sp.]